MPYSPLATDAAAPLDTEKASTAAAEFRALKSYIQSTLVLVPKITTSWFSGKMTRISAGQTLNSSDMAEGKIFGIVNVGAADIVITQGAGVTLRLAGTESSGSFSLPPKGMALIWCDSTTVAYVVGTGLSMT